MDPRRRIDEKAERIRTAQPPFIEKYTDTILIEQSLGKPVESEIIVIRIHKRLLKLYSFLLFAFVIITVITVFSA